MQANAELEEFGLEQGFTVAGTRESWRQAEACRGREVPPFIHAPLLAHSAHMAECACEPGWEGHGGDEDGQEVAAVPTPRRTAREPLRTRAPCCECQKPRQTDLVNKGKL